MAISPLSLIFHLLKKQMKLNNKNTSQGIWICSNFYRVQMVKGIYSHTNGLILNLMLYLYVNCFGALMRISHWLYFPIHSCPDGHLASSLQLWLCSHLIRLCFQGLPLTWAAQGQEKCLLFLFFRAAFLSTPSPAPSLPKASVISQDYSKAH